ncbi:MAG: hypothetical protein FWD71_19070 [Oscillospiraceae bacterium]|nr:hypothetical protein [Oscillospiraceae bacterium]
MKKAKIVIIAVALSVFMMFLPVLAASDGDSFGTIPTASGIQIDGVKDAAYDSGVKIDIGTVYDTDKIGGVPDATGTAWLLWDGVGNLHVFATVTKKDVNSPADNQINGSPWNTDSVEVFIDPYNDGTYAFQYRIDSTGYPSEGAQPTWIQGYGTAGDTPIMNPFQYAAKITSVGFDVEFSIPLSNVVDGEGAPAVTGIAAGKQIGLQLQINDMLSDGSDRAGVVVAASKNQADSWDVTKYNYIVLGSNDVTPVATTAAPVVAVDTTAAPAAPAQPAPATGDSYIFISLTLMLGAAGIFALSKKRKI